MFRILKKNLFGFSYILTMFVFAGVSDGQVEISPPKFEARGAFVAIVVSDLKTSLYWYQSILGLHLLKRSRSPQGAAESAILQGRNFAVELIHFDERPAANAIQAGQSPLLGIVKVGVFVGAKSFDSLAKSLRRRDVEFVGGIFEDIEMKARSFLIKDNDGNLVQFFSKMRRQMRRTN